MSTTGDRSDLSIVVPVRNDGTRIRPFLETVCGHLSHRRGWEVLVVDDASDDDTCIQVLACAIASPGISLLRDPARLGCGYAARHGVSLALGKRIALLTPDLPAPIATLDRLEAAIEGGCDLAFASPRVREDRPLPPVRIRDELLRAFLTPPAKRERPGDAPRARLFQLYRRRAAAELFGRQRLHGAGFAVEILYLARRFGYDVREVAFTGPTQRVPRSGEVGELLQIRMHRLRGDYG